MERVIYVNGKEYQFDGNYRLDNAIADYADEFYDNGCVSEAERKVGITRYWDGNEIFIREIDMTYEEWIKLYKSYDCPYEGGWRLCDYEKAEWYDMAQSELIEDYPEYADKYFYK